MKTAILILIFFFAVWILVWLIQQWGKRNFERDRKYDWLYDYISGQLELPVNEPNYQILKSEFEQLRKFNNREKTDVLYDNFLRKYGKLHCGKLIKDYADKLKNR